MSDKTGSKKEQKSSSAVRRSAEREPGLTPTFAATRHHTTGGEWHTNRSSVGNLSHHERSSLTSGSRFMEKETSVMGGDLVAGYDLSRIPTHTIQTSRAPNNQPNLQRQVGRPADRVKHHLQSLPEQSQTGSDRYHEDIARFQREHSPADIRARRQRLSAAPEGLISREDDKTCGPSDGLNFTSDGFSASAGDTITATPRAGGLYVDLESGSFDASGKVQVSGGRDSKAQRWDAGFIQTATAMRVTGHYVGSPKYKKRTFAMPGPRRDALEKRGAPWYDPDNSDGLGPRSFTKTNQEAEVKLHDRPILPFMWHTDDEKGKLSHTEGKMQFTAWLIARRRRGIHTIFFLNWAMWQVDFAATFNYASKGDKSVKAIQGATTVTETGTGKGPGGSVLGGELAKDSVGQCKLSKWE